MSLPVNNLVNSITATTQESLQNDEDARARLLAAAQALCIRLEKPFDFIQRVTWQEVADDISLFEHIGIEGSAAKSIEELARATSVDPELLKRITRHLAARHILKEEIPRAESVPKTSLGSYAATHISAALATREGSSGIRQTCNVYHPNFLAMPALLKEQGYLSPTNNRDGPFQRRHGLVGSTAFECFQLPEHRPLAEDFNLLMKFTTQGRRSFLDVCDVDSLLRARPFAPTGRDKTDGGADRYLFVDIGGGTGTDATAFRRRVPDASGKVELQELPAVIEAARTAKTVVDSGILLRAHDFFNEQPVQAPRFFFMGSVLHDWPDPDATRILRRLAAAMKPDYTTLLLSENILTDTSSIVGGCHPHLSAIDLTMMTSLASRERSERDWSKLLTDAGLRLVRIHSIPSCLKSVLECELSE